MYLAKACLDHMQNSITGRLTFFLKFCRGGKQIQGGNGNFITAKIIKLASSSLSPFILSHFNAYVCTMVGNNVQTYWPFTGQQKVCHWNDNPQSKHKVHEINRLIKGLEQAGWKWILDVVTMKLNLTKQFDIGKNGSYRLFVYEYYFVTYSKSCVLISLSIWSINTFISHF